ncbi:MAG: YggS family pyridoxal phosphate-dependent enzyme [Gammaproteobacteria bacterium]
MTNIKQNFMELQTQIRLCEAKYHRPPNSVFLLAVTKGQSIEKISAAIDAGQTAFGENYLQEALPKIAFFTGKNLEWHFIGPIQSNKTKKIAEHFSWVHSVTNIKVLQRLNDQRPEHLPPLNVCIEVNISEEPTKSGVNIDDIFAVADHCISSPRLILRGLMAIPSLQKNFIDQRASFHKLALLFEKLREKGYMLDTLSIGMSSDWEAAVAEGSTMIRIGTALFGGRN